MGGSLQFCIVGLQRTGTNFASYYIANKFPERLCRLIHKHSLPDDNTAKELKGAGNVAVALIVRHPVLWVESLTRNAPHDFYTMHREVLGEHDADASVLGKFYSDFYEGWLKLADDGADITIFRYEDILRDDGKSFCAWLDQKAGEDGEAPPPPDKLRESPAFSAEDRQKALDFRTSLTQPEIDAVMANQVFLARAAGYSSDQLQLSSTVSARTFLYEFARRGAGAARSDTSTALRVAAEYPQSPLANLAADIAVREQPGYRGEFLESMKNLAVNAMGQSVMSGAEVEALINLTIDAARPAVASFLLTAYEEANLSFGKLLSLKIKVANAENQRKDAERLLRIGAELLPGDANIGIQYAHLLLNQNCGEEAIEVMNRLHEARGPDSWVLGTRGFIQLRLGHLDAAERDLRMSLDLLRNAGDLQRHDMGARIILLARILMQAGKFAEAREQLDAVTDYPATDYYRSEIAHIRNVLDSQP